MTKDNGRLILHCALKCYSSYVVLLFALACYSSLALLFALCATLRKLHFASATLAVDDDDDRLRTITIGITFLPFVTLLSLSVMLTIPLLSC